jgi:hypothetical protein|tara:strand:- start:414 stop:1109 length:696 start_codon:yes stop_codon:yes gene_type:complete
MKRSELKNVIREQTEKAVKQCPAPTQNLELNTLNRNRAISADFIKYGPLNLSDEGYWEEYAKKWGETTSPEEAKNSNCSNCVAFDISERMESCMPGATDEDGRLGYCWMHHFKCHSARTCYTWAAGGPINDDESSYDWQKRNLKGALDKEPIEAIEENLRNWFKKEDWVRIDTQGNIAGKCGTMKKGKKTQRCLPRAKANSLTKAQRAATSRKKTASSKQYVKNTKKAGGK